MVYSTGRCLIDPNLPVYSFSATPSSAAPVDPLLPFSLFFDLFIFSCFFNSFFSRFESFRLNSPVAMLGENPPPFACIFSCSLLFFPPLWLPYAKMYYFSQSQMQIQASFSSMMWQGIRNLIQSYLPVYLSMNCFGEACVLFG